VIGESRGITLLEEGFVGLSSLPDDRLGQQDQTRQRRFAGQQRI
jgi:hypothetical protein